MIAAAIRKEIQLLLRDRGALASLFVLPVVFIAVFGAMFSGGGQQAQKVAFWAAPGARGAGAIATALGKSRGFVLERERGAAAVRARVASGKAPVGIVIPKSFDPTGGRPAELVIDQGESPEVRQPLEAALTQIAARALSGGRMPRIFAPRSPPGVKKPLANVDIFEAVVPDNAVLFGFFLALTVAISFVEERKSGTWRRALAAPVPRSMLLFAKLVPFYVIGLVQMALLFGIGAAVFGMRVAGSVAALAALTAVVVFCVVSLGLLIASFGGTQKQVGAIGSIALLVMGMLGGAMVPRMVMPASMKKLGLLVPHAWALDGYYDLLIRKGTTLVDVLHPMAAIAGFGVAFAVIGALKFRFER